MGNFKDNRRNHNRSRDTYRVHRSRAVGCWNCGLPHHVSRDCTAPKVERCARCRKRGVETSRCGCSRRDRDRQSDKPSSSRGRIDVTPRVCDPIEPATLAIIHSKHIKAVVNTGSQHSRIGENVYAHVRRNQEVNPKKKLIKTSLGIELVYTVVVRVGIQQDRKYPIEFIVDTKIPASELMLGMTALKTLGYRITVAGQETRERPAAKKPEKPHPKKRVQRRPQPASAKYNSDSEQDRISFLDEDEARRIREWEY